MTVLDGSDSAGTAAGPPPAAGPPLHRGWYAYPGMWLSLALLAAVVAAVLIWAPASGAAGGCGGG